MTAGEIFAAGCLTGAAAFCLIYAACLKFLPRLPGINRAKKNLAEILAEAGHSEEVIAEAIAETYRSAGELPADSFAHGIHTRTGGGWFLIWDRPGRKGPAPYVKEITL